MIYEFLESLDKEMAMEGIFTLGKDIKNAVKQFRDNYSLKAKETKYEKSETEKEIDAICQKVIDKFNIIHEDYDKITIEMVLKDVKIWINELKKSQIILKNIKNAIETSKGRMEDRGEKFDIYEYYYIKSSTISGILSLIRPTIFESNIIQLSSESQNFNIDITSELTYPIAQLIEYKYGIGCDTGDGDEGCVYLSI